MVSRKTDRFELLRPLGRGGMGVVFEAYDRVRGMRVALKTLRRLEPARLLHFKREFRALSNLSHPNIIDLYELVSREDEWFFTMELIEGVDIATYVRRHGPGAADLATDMFAGAAMDASADAPPTARISWEHATPADTDEHVLMDALRWSDDAGGWTVLETGGTLPAPVFAALEGSPQQSSPWHDEVPADLHRPGLDELADQVRLRAAMSQLAHALDVLHTAGMVHCDLKPSNVMVSREGRVVLMDFGVVSELAAPRVSASTLTGYGTPAFMAPEQARGEPPTMASDWYAFGSILYLLLTGRLPFGGSLASMLLGKQEADPLPPRTFTRDVPDELEQLCMRLLARDVALRPGYREVLAALGTGDLSHRSAGALDRGSDRGIDRAGSADIFVGRERERAILWESYAAVQAGDTRCVIVQGLSGMGKSSLVEHFLASLGESAPGAAPGVARGPAVSEALVLTGRCHERESLAYKAFDGILDQLSLHLLDLPDHERGPLLPSNIPLLTRVFPVLRRLPECEVTVTIGGSIELRGQAVQALRALLTKLASTRPVVIRIEDLQWADDESFDLLRGLLAPPAPPGLIILATLRQEALHTGESAALDAFLASMTGRSLYRPIALGALSTQEQRALMKVLDERRMLPQRIDEALWQECAGHPMLLAELVRYAKQTRGALAPGGRLHLEDIIWQRVERLPDAAHALLEIMAIAGEPMPLRVLAHAAGLAPVAGERARSILSINRLARLARSGSHMWLDVYHDKVREAILERLPGAHAGQLHRQLTDALSAWEQAPVALLARHWLAVGESDKAVAYLMDAAHSATEQLAFGRAAELYRTVIEVLAGAAGDPAADLRRCQAWIELARGMRIVDRNDEALALLDRAQAVAERHALVGALSEIHCLRGNLFFPKGDLDGCLREHERARALARQAGSPRCEASALSGLGDAYYMHGRMLTAYEHYDGCITLCRAHGFADIEAANLSMRGIMHIFQCSLEHALRDGTAAAEMAARIGHARAEINARSSCMGIVLIEMGELARAREEFERAREMARKMGARRFEATAMLFLGWILTMQGHGDQGRPLVADGIALCREAGFAYVGPMGLGLQALVTDSDAARARALAEAQRMLDAGSASHNYLYFYRYIMDMALATGDLDRVEACASALEDFNRGEPSPWSRFFVARGRALVTFMRGVRDDGAMSTLDELYRRACRSGLHMAAQSLRWALESAGRVP